MSKKDLNTDYRTQYITSKTNFPDYETTHLEKVFGDLAFRLRRHDVDVSFALVAVRQQLYVLSLSAWSLTSELKGRKEEENYIQ
jgi:hypothetical protein